MTRGTTQNGLVIPAPDKNIRGQATSGIQFIRLDSRLRGNDGLVRRTLRMLGFAFLALASVSCGFHLRGAGAGGALPDALLRLRVKVADSKLANDPLRVLMKNAIQNDPRAKLTEEPDAPALVLSGERAESQVLTVGTTGRVTGYMLKYEVSYKLVDAKGFELQSPQTVRLIRDYTFDALNVLAKQQEEEELKRTMQQDAVQQIMRRLSRYTPK
jgi:LPS-assembly lipoprotein